MRLQTVIIGAGAAGVAAATRLLHAGITDFVILEAEQRIGGRVHSIELDGATADLGAQWVHGEKGNCVFALAQDKVTPDPLMSNWAGAEFYTEHGNKLSEDTQGLLYGWLTDIDTETKVKLKNFKGSLGDYFTQEYEKRLAAHDDSSLDKNLALSFLSWYEQFEDSIDAADTWFETSGVGHLSYVDCEGELLNMWKSGGYRSLINLLINQLPNPDDFHSRVLLNREVSTVSWGQGNGVKITCADGSVFESDRLLSTVSLGVLKYRAASLFYPPLPPVKLNAIAGLSIGTVDKIFLRFPHRWWREDSSGFCMLWTNKENDLPPHQGWLQYVFGFFPVAGLPNTLCGWVVGPPARHMELLSDKEVSQGCLSLLRKFLSRTHQVPDCIEVRRSQWYSNPHFRGSYSFRSMTTERLQTDASMLAQPVIDNTGKPVLLFAGEATHDNFFSTVHGAVETGWREADRIMSLTSSSGGGKSKLENHEVVIIGAGLAGLAAARTLQAAGVTDFAILEAQSCSGGRAMTVNWDGGGGFIEAGAQWIHGQKGNALFRLARDSNLLSSHAEDDAEGQGPYLCEDGTAIAPEIVSNVENKVDEILEECERFCKEDVESPPSMGTFLEQQFHQSLRDSSLSEREPMLQLLDWHRRFQLIDNSCDSLEELSAERWGDYAICAGVDYNSLKDGFSSLVASIESGLPPATLKFNSEVITVQYTTSLQDNQISSETRKRFGLPTTSKPWCPPCVITCKDGRKFGAQNVIITCSLGVLKSKYRSMFLPALPPRITQAIEDLGFGSITKIYMDYKEPWWTPDERGIQLLWSSNRPSLEEEWTRDLSGFDILPCNGNVLLGWVGGEGAKIVENIPEKDIATQCTSLLSRFLKRDLPKPDNIYRSTWYKNEHFRGAYSHATTKCDASGSRPADLLIPVFASSSTNQLQLPILLFAGEAAHPSYFSTTHGAYETGIMQAQKILSSTHRAKY